MGKTIDSLTRGCFVNLNGSAGKMRTTRMRLEATSAVLIG
jgi:hypothetical protein